MAKRGGLVVMLDAPKHGAARVFELTCSCCHSWKVSVFATPEASNAAIGLMVEYAMQRAAKSGACAHVVPE